MFEHIDPEKLTWDQIGKLLKAKELVFADQSHEDSFYSHVCGFMRKYGVEWVHDNRHEVIDRWEFGIKPVLLEMGRKQKRKEKKKGLRKIFG